MAIHANGKTGEIIYTCEACAKTISEEEYDFCGKCLDCRDKCE